MANYRVHHKTVYDYETDVAMSHHSARLEPLNSWGQTLHSFRLLVDPEPRDMVRRADYFGNAAHFFSISEPHRHMEVEAFCNVTVHPRGQLMPVLTPTSAEVRAAMRGAATHELVQASEFVLPSPRIPFLDESFDFARDVLGDERPVLDAALALCGKIHASFKFKPGVTDASSPIEALLKHGQGVCQDFAHFAISCLRSHGIPAAYISGYLRTIPPPGKARLVGADASHAWISIFIPRMGWVDLDPTNNCLVQEDHIAVARGRDYGDLSLIRGSILGGGAQTMQVAVTVEPVASI
jgi:transglutaminase-like putative cysteine protease